MIAANDGDGKATFPNELFVQIAELAGVMEAVDEAEDIALDLHTTPFSPDARQRALQWLNSEQYTSAARKFRTLESIAETERGTGEAS